MPQLNPLTATLLVLLFTSCSEPEGEENRVDGHEFHVDRQEGTLRFTSAATGEETVYDINGDSCYWTTFSTRKGDRWNWSDTPRFVCDLNDDTQADLSILSLPESAGWPEESSNDEGSFTLWVPRSMQESLFATSLPIRVTVTRAQGEVLPIPSGATAETPDLELATDDYVREYTVEAEADCSDDPECGGIWTLELHVTQTADDVVPLYVYED